MTLMVNFKVKIHIYTFTYSMKILEKLYNANVFKFYKRRIQAKYKYVCEIIIVLNLYNENNNV